MQFIVITHPQFIPGEAQLIECLFRAGLCRLHLRKPGASADDLRRLLDQLPASLLPRIVTHDHHLLAREYGLGGIHLNSRNPAPPAGFTPDSLSASCHSIDELARRKPSLTYATLSPVFSSVSKPGYHAAFTQQQLDHAAASGIIDSRVVALGGITLDTIPQLARWPFGGAALLGDIWQRAGTPRFASHAAMVSRALDAL